jgi:hypothetical protein
VSGDPAGQKPFHRVIKWNIAQFFWFFSRFFAFVSMETENLGSCTKIQQSPLSVARFKVPGNAVGRIESRHQIK